MQGHREGMGMVVAAEVSTPDSDGGVVGGGVEDSVVGHDDGVDWLRVGLDCLYALEV